MEEHMKAKQSQLKMSPGVSVKHVLSKETNLYWWKFRW